MDITESDVAIEIETEDLYRSELTEHHADTLLDWHIDYLQRGGSPDDAPWTTHVKAYCHQHRLEYVLALAYLVRGTLTNGRLGRK